MKKLSLMMIAVAGATLMLTTSCHSVRAAEKTTTVTVTDNGVYSVTVDGVPQEVITSDLTPDEKFSYVSMAGATNVTIKKGNYKVVVTGAKSIVNKVRIVSDGSTLSMDKALPVNITITMPKLKGIVASGATNITVENDITDAGFDINATGAANMRFGNIKADKSLIGMSGGARLSVTSITGRESNLNVSGGAAVDVNTANCTNLNCNISGAAIVTIDHVKSDDLKLGCSGGANVNCKNIDTKELSALSSGGSGVTISGSAQKATLQASGAARINAKGLKCKDIKHQTSGVSSIEL